MTRKIKKGYDWAEEQQEKWEAIAADKIEQLNKLSQTHMDWFDKHATISDILAWKNPLLESRKKDFPKEEKCTLDLQNQEETIQTAANEQIAINLSQESADEKDLAASNDRSRSELSIRKSKNKSSSTFGDIILPQVISDHTNGPQQNDNYLSLSSEVNDSENSTSTSTGERITAVSSLNSSDSKTILKGIDAQISIAQADNSIPKPAEPPVLNTTTTLTSTIKRVSSISKTSDEEIAICTPELITDLDCQQTQTQTQKDPQTPESYAQVEMEVVNDDFRLDTLQSGHNEKEEYDDSRLNNSLCKYDEEYDDEENDEIQLVVSKRNFEDEYMQGELNSNSKSPIRAAIVQSTISPPRNMAPPNPTNSSPIRHQSPFMSRLFQFGSTATNDKSTKKDISFITARPKSTVSTSTINSEASNNLSMSLLEHPDKKRPLEPVCSEIEVSEAMPQSRFKRPKSLFQKGKVGQNPTESIPESKLDQAEAADVKSEKDKGEDRKDEAEYIIPSWAKGPELTLHLKNQSGLDPDRIFGPITPLSLKDIFSHSHKYLTKIPKQAPQ